MERTLRLGLVIYGSLDTVSGGYLYDRRLVQYLRQRGDSVEIISQPWAAYPGRLWQNADRSLANRLAGLNLDLLLQDELNHPSLFLQNRRLKGLGGLPLVSIVHHLRSSELHPAAQMALYRRVEKRYLRSVDGFVFNSQTTRAAVEGLVGLPVQGVVATPGGDRFGERLSEEAVSARARKAGPLRVLFVGNIIPRKGLAALIEALATLPYAGWVLRIIGREDADPQYARAIRALVQRRRLSKNVLMLGELEDEFLVQEWKRCDVLAVPSQYEGFGIVYLEGMHFGVPALGSSAGATGEIIRDGENGFLIPPGDRQILAERLALLARDRARLEQMSLAALRHSAGALSWEASAEKVRAYLLEVAKNG